MGVQVSLPVSLPHSVSVSVPDWCLALLHELCQHADPVSLQDKHVALQSTLNPWLAAVRAGVLRCPGCVCGPVTRPLCLVQVTATTMLQRGA